MPRFTRAVDLNQIRSRSVSSLLSGGDATATSLLAAASDSASTPPVEEPSLSASRNRGTGVSKMAKSSRNVKYSSRELRSTRYLRPFSHCSFKRVASQVPTLAATEKCAWKDAICPVCIECPHDAVLLLCSSHDKGCRPYVCGTDFIHSNCLEQLMESCRSPGSCDDPSSVELTCPLCRGEVKGYTLVEPAREQLNQNRRNCMQDGCSYIGTYRHLCKHARKKHPSAKPRAADPQHTYRWRRLVFRTALQDMICATNSPTVRGLLSAMLWLEELMSSCRLDDDHLGATNESSV